MVALNYYYTIAGDFGALKNSCGENKALQIVSDNEQKQFDDGIYIKTYTVHALSTLSEEEMPDVKYVKFLICTFALNSLKYFKENANEYYINIKRERYILNTISAKIFSNPTLFHQRVQI